MKKLSFGKTEKFRPSLFCDKFNYIEQPISFPIENIKFEKNAQGVKIEFPIRADEHFYGLGLQLECFDFSGKKASLKVNADPATTAGDSHAPVPFVLSTKGYGVYFDTARYMEIYFHRRKKASLKKSSNKAFANSFEELYAERINEEETFLSAQIFSAKGVDLYIMEGETLTEVVSKYNMLSGGGANPPLWAFGTIYRCHMEWGEEKVLDIAQYFKEKNLPIDVIGLEPGWQSRSYSCSYLWDKTRFPNAKQTIKTLYNMGYHVNLWEHAFIHSDSPLFKKLKSRSADYTVWDGLVPDFNYKDTSDIFADFHKKYVTFGLIDGFKLDECDGSDYTGGWSFPNFTKFPSGLDGEQYHCLFGTLYMKTMLKVTGSDTLSQVRNAGALNASYPFVLYSDLYNHKSFIRGLATCGFSGLLWSPELRHAKSKEDLLRRLQTVVFSPQCLINAFYCQEVPWTQFDCEKEVKELLDLRETLKPMLKKAFVDYHKTGKPPVRALVSDYTDDKETYKIDDQYIFCDNLIVAPMVEGEISRKVYLPDGVWVDYFTKKRVSSGWNEVCGDNIPVFEKITKI